jgi:Zn-dependent M16 (insulinase) family peptidase
LGFLSTQKRSAEALDEAIKLYSGGISFSPSINNNPHDLAQHDQRIYLTTHCLDQSQCIEKTFDLVREIIHESLFDQPERIKTLLGECQNAKNSLAYRGHTYAMSAASRHLSASQHLSDQIGGLSHLEFLNSLDLSRNEDIQTVIEKLQALSAFFLKTQEGVMAMLTCESETMGRNKEHVQELLSRLGWSLNDRFYVQPSWSLKKESKQEFYRLPFNVNYVGQAFATVPYIHPDSMALQVSTSLMSTQFLHKELREKGGAYGGGVRFSALEGTVAFYTYRDPVNSLSRTLDVFKQSFEWAGQITHKVGQRVSFFLAYQNRNWTKPNCPSLNNWMLQ